MNLKTFVAHKPGDMIVGATKVVMREINEPLVCPSFANPVKNQIFETMCSLYSLERHDEKLLIFDRSILDSNQLYEELISIKNQNINYDFFIDSSSKIYVNDYHKTVCTSDGCLNFLVLGPMFTIHRTLDPKETYRYYKGKLFVKVLNIDRIGWISFNMLTEDYLLEFD